ncbi:glycosyltransferase [Aerococcus urinaeequi]|uniref:glycosyltransferase n=1 Tax=Aerococcus urinaeequi TaxID=51665 RepID=UPI003AAC88C9
MKVLHILFSNRFGGAEKVAMDIISHGQNSIESLYCCYEGDITEILKEKNLNFIHLKNITSTSIAKIVKEHNITIIHAHDFRASIIASSLHKKVKVISHIHQSPHWLNNIFSLKFISYKMISHRFSKILLTSIDIKNTKLFANIKQTLVLPNFVKKDDTIDIPQRKVYDFIFVGRFESIKRPRKFIQIIKEIQDENPSVTALMVGTGSLFEEIRNEIKEKKINIKLVGFVNDPQVYIAKSSFLINTSISEGFGIASVEAMQLGVPVITYKNGGVSDEIATGSNGIIITEEAKLAKKLNGYLTSNHKYKKLSENSKKLGSKYNNYSEWIKIIQSVYED